MHLYDVARKATVFFNKQFRQYIGIVHLLKLMFWTNNNEYSKQRLYTQKSMKLYQQVISQP